MGCVVNKLCNWVEILRYGLDVMAFTVRSPLFDDLGEKTSLLDSHLLLMMHSFRLLMHLGH